VELLSAAVFCMGSSADKPVGEELLPCQLEREGANAFLKAA
jgi:hypothetical protein